eukprot:9156515-Alexandrium_andersonii.AAC.1
MSKAQGDRWRGFRGAFPGGVRFAILDSSRLVPRAPKAASEWCPGTVVMSTCGGPVRRGR